MPTQAETTARRIARDLYAYTDGRIGRWATLDTIKRRLVLGNGKALDATLEVAVAKNCLLIEGGHSMCLTDAGRRLRER